MQRYLQPDLLQKADLQTFDDWASTFGEVVSQLEIKPAGNGFQMKNRFSKFVNIPELMQMYKEFADIQTPDTLDLDVPKTNMHNIVVKPTEMQIEMVKQLSERAIDVHNRSVPPETDNMLKITSDGKKIGLDQRLMNPLLPDVYHKERILSYG